jgi:hypothetical protein
MTTEEKTNKGLAKEKPSTSRMIWGTIVLVTGFLSPLLIPLVLASELCSALKSILSGLLAFGIPELFMLLAIAIFGKAGFNYLKRFISLFIRKYGPADDVSKLRYRFGLVLFCIPLFVGLIIPYVLLEIELSNEILLPLTIGTDLLLLISIFILGGNFWDKLRGLFIHKAIVTIKTEKS